MMEKVKISLKFIIKVKLEKSTKLVRRRDTGRALGLKRLLVLIRRNVLPNGL